MRSVREMCDTQLQAYVCNCVSHMNRLFKMGVKKVILIKNAKQANRSV